MITVNVDNGSGLFVLNLVVAVCVARTGSNVAAVTVAIIDAVVVVAAAVTIAPITAQSPAGAKRVDNDVITAAAAAAIAGPRIVGRVAVTSCVDE